MPRAITCEELSKAVQDGSIIEGGNIKCAEGIKYDFQMGSRVLKAAYGQPVDISGLSEADRANMFVEPGEVVFVLTEETLKLPKNMIIQLVPKRKLSHQGIIVLGGLCVDPLYRGKLLVGLYNFSSTRFPLRPGKKLIAAIFFELQEGETDGFKEPDQPVTDFPDELVNLIQSYKPIALQGLQEGIKSLESQVAALKNEITSGREWQRQFQGSLERHDQQIDRLLQSLGEEKENRLAADQTFKDQLAKLQFQSWKNGAILAAIAGAIASLLTVLGQIYLPKLLGH